MDKTLIGVRRTVFAAAAASLIAVSGCQTTKTVSVEEAKELTADIHAEFVPPPRTITDITKILDDPAYLRSERAAEELELANSAAPSGANDRALAEFYLRRGIAAQNVGRPLQYREDLQRSWDHMQADGGFDGKRRSQLLSRLAWAQLETSQFQTAIETMRFAESQRQKDGGRQGNLSRMAAWLGQMEEAKEWRRRAAASMARWPAEFSGWRRYFLARADAAIAESEGRWAEAEIFARGALAGAEQGTEDDEEIPVKAHLRRELAKNLRRQGKLAEAELAARESVTFAVTRLGKNSPTTATAVTEFALVLAAQGRLAEAELLLDEAIEIHREVQTFPGSWRFGWSRMAMGQVLLAQERYGEASAIIDQAVTDVRSASEQMFQAWFADIPELPIARLMSGEPEAAYQLAEANVKRTERQFGTKHLYTARALATRGMASTVLGRSDAAVADFRKALPILTSNSRNVDNENSAAQGYILRLTLEHYLRALSNLNADGADISDEAFRVAGLARGRAVEQALAANAARAASRDPVLADLARREQDARGQIAGQFGVLTKLLNAPSEERDEAAILDLRTRIADLRAARAALAEEIERQFPDYAALTNPKPLSIAETQISLQDDESVVSVYLGPKQLYVWAIPKSGAAAFATEPVGSRTIDAMVSELRAALDPGAETLGDIPEFNLQIAYRLYETVLKPVEDGWKQSDSILFVPHGSLGYLPLSVLPTNRVLLPPEKAPLFSNYQDVPWLARSHAVTVLPSVASLQTLRSLPDGAPDRSPLIAFGDPYFSVEQAKEAAVEQPLQLSETRGLGAIRGVPLHLRAAPQTATVDSAQLAMLPRLPDTRDEVESIALALDADVASSVFVGNAANEEQVKSMDLSRQKVVAFATHGLVPGDLDGLTQPALAMSSPESSGTPGDGLLTMGEILGLRLNADWVVLSACNTGSADGMGAEAVSGLGRAFFYAGSRALLVSNWPVHSASAKELTTDLFHRQAKSPQLSRAEALRQAMTGLIDGDGFKDREGRSVFSYAHPLFWAPFSLVGDGGGHSYGS